MKYLGYIVIIFIAFASCKPGIPSDVLSEGTMEDVLYDFHVAQSMSNYSSIIKDQKEVIALRASILEKHGISKAEWDRSYLFYCGHADYLHEIYENLNERMNDDVVALGGKADGMTEGEEADSTNIWNQESHFILMQMAPYDRISFTVTPDTTFHDGDRINLQYESQLLIQEGARDVIVSMNVFYDRSSGTSKAGEAKSDSIATRTNHVAMDGAGVISISNDVDRLHVKKITGFFLMSKNNSNGLMGEPQKENIPIFKLAAFKNVKLLHQHTNPPAPPSSKERQDSIRNDSSNVTRPGTPPSGPGGNRPIPRPDNQ